MKDKVFALAALLACTSAAADTLVPFCDIQHARACTDVMAQYLSTISTNVTNNVNAAYAGSALDPNSATQAYLAGLQFPTPVCNLWDTAYTKAGEVTVNHVPQKCGTPGSAPTPCQVTCALDATVVPPAIVCGPSTSAASCSVERTWIWGALMDLVAQSQTQVLKEVANRGLTLGAACKAAVASQGDVLSTFNQTQSGWTGYWTAGGGTVPACDTTTDVGSPVEGTCYLNSATNSLEAYFFPVATCEIFARAQSAWSTTTLPTLDAVPDGLLHGAAKACYIAALTQLTPAQLIDPYVGAAQIASCTNAAYAGVYTGVFQARGAYTLLPLPNPPPLPTVTLQWTAVPAPVPAPANLPFDTAIIASMQAAFGHLSDASTHTKLAQTLITGLGVSVAPYEQAPNE